METNLVSIEVKAPPPVIDGATRSLQMVNDKAVVTKEDYEVVAQWRASISTRLTELDNQRAELKKPTLEAGRKIDAFFKPAMDALTKAKEIATAKLQEFDTEQRRIAAKKQQEADEEARKIREAAEKKAREERQRAQMAMSEIQGMQQQVIIAQIGRSGVRKGGSLECIQETLKETEGWPVTEEHFGTFFEAAKNAKASAITAIKALEQAFIAKQESAASEKTAAESRNEAVRARAAEIQAKESQERAEKETARLQAESDARIAQLETVATTTVAEEVKVEVVEVAGLSRAKTLKWRLKDKSKLKDDFLLVDEKAINKIVAGMKERAHSVVGEGAIELYTDESIRQR